MTKEEFVQQAYTAALKSSQKSGLPAAVTVAQAALESSWGQSKLSIEAKNYFGIKSHGKHDRIEMTTKECGNGLTVAIMAEFAKYNSMLECFECRNGILAHSAAYASAREKLGDEMAFIHELAKHWATDPKYAAKLTSVLSEVKGILSRKE